MDLGIQFSRKQKDSQLHFHEVDFSKSSSAQSFFTL